MEMFVAGEKKRGVRTASRFWAKGNGVKTQKDFCQEEGRGLAF